MPTLRQLEYLDAIARTGSITRAADLVGVSQPGLSTQIRDLEAKLGIALVERMTYGVRMTSAGRELAERAAVILRHVSELKACAQTHIEPLTGTLSVGIIPSIAPYLLPFLLPLIANHHPNLDLGVEEQPTEIIMQGLEDGRLDVCVLALPVHGNAIETKALFDDRFLLALPPAYKVSGEFADSSLTKTEPLLLLGDGHCFRDQALEFCAQRSIEHLDTLAMSNLSCIADLVGTGMGISLLPEMAIDQLCVGDRVKVQRFKDPEPLRKIGLAWREQSPRIDDFETLADLVITARPECSA